MNKYLTIDECEFLTDGEFDAVAMAEPGDCRSFRAFGKRKLGKGVIQFARDNSALCEQDVELNREFSNLNPVERMA